VSSSSSLFSLSFLAMKIKYIAAFSILLLTSCSFSDETPQEPIQTGSIQNTPVIQTGSTQVTPEIVEVEASNVKDIPLTLVDGK